MSEAIDTFWSAAGRALHAGRLAKLTLSKPRRKDPATPRNLYARPVELKGETVLQVTHRYADREEAKNYAPEAGLAYLTDQLATTYYNGDLFTLDEQLSLLQSRKGNARLRGEPARHETPVLAHNRQKYRDIPADRPYLHALGITTADGQVTAAGRRKYKQINKFVEIVDNLVHHHPLPAGAHLVDMGSGSGYLTFVLYDHLTNTLGLEVNVTGVELRPALVEKGRQIAAENGFDRLNFVEGYIDSYHPDRLDVLIALHACDTATDDALFRGITAGAEIMIVAPCCQKQVRRDMEVPDDLRPLLDSGIMLERQAAMLTDGLRALYLQGRGYATRIFEFIPLEHTAKNVMITAVKSEGQAGGGARVQWEALKQRFGVKRHYLEELLKG
ncbi:SAM-dependent methyltransferase [Lewinella marina]|uniref:SAM-dependent methyltransferase n=1 Tax=Neolewinella marina TaxID=438751 RepID=A0A2G0CEL1_9BACT|nr:SAM-dependent methyltransferase [Neolewinella marina]NJB87324.1 SAM-dependent methyltransferase [Neolewinella marina]PHK98357.1 SAM-dependent methyltransferase [Neolewinella marina]